MSTRWPISRSGLCSVKALYLPKTDSMASELAVGLHDQPQGQLDGQHRVLMLRRRRLSLGRRLPLLGPHLRLLGGGSARFRLVPLNPGTGLEH